MLKKTARPIKKSLLYIAAIIVILFLYILVALASHVWPFVANGQPTTNQITNKDSTPPANPDANISNSATDTLGSIPTQQAPSSSMWTKSKDGSSIVVMSPVSKGLVKSGDSIYGTAESDKVFYELEDDVSGIILQGEVSVVDGRFSIKLNFSTSGTNGRINIYNQVADGTESNNVSIDVRFK